MLRIMIIRHAEKHHGHYHHGVSIEGLRKKHELTVMGWQRAGALVRFFAPADGLPPGAGISTPRSIFASASTPKSPSLRARRTVEPLAAALGILIDDSHAEGHERAVALAVLDADSPVLISWHHSHIADLATRIVGKDLGWPEWPDERFDVVWVLDRPESGHGAWTFSQVPQRLFAHDRPEPL
jgi:broad specificity phosphatase PhoE